MIKEQSKEQPKKEEKKEKKPLSKIIPKYYGSEKIEPKENQLVSIAKSRGYLLYIFPVINYITVFSFLFFIIFVVKSINIWSILFIILSFPITIVSTILLAVKLFLDLRKLRQFIRPKITSNFIRAFFLTNNKRIIEYIAKINSDGMSFDLGERTYIVDKKTIWTDNNRHPCSFYFPELPNPIKLNPEKAIDEFIKNIRDGKEEENIDDEGELVDISFSSTNLQLYKKSKIFDELNKNPSAEKMQLALIGVIVILIIVIVVLALAK